MSAVRDRIGRVVRCRRAAFGSVLAAGVLLGLSGCGFHLRGALGGDRLPARMSVTYLRSGNPHGPFAVDLRRALQANGVRMTDDRTRAGAVLSIVQDSFGRRVLSVGASGRAQEYELIYTVRVELSDRAGKVLYRLPPIRRTRDFLFDEAAVLGMEREQQILYEDMRKDIVQDVIRRLAAR